MNELTQHEVKLQIRWLIAPAFGVLIVVAIIMLVATGLWSRTASGANSWTDCYHYWEDDHGVHSSLKTLPSSRTECSLPNGKRFVD
jgi:hypothetical protein